MCLIVSQLIFFVYIQNSGKPFPRVVLPSLWQWLTQIQYHSLQLFLVVDSATWEHPLLSNSFQSPVFLCSEFWGKKSIFYEVMQIRNIIGFLGYLVLLTFIPQALLYLSKSHFPPFCPVSFTHVLALQWAFKLVCPKISLNSQHPYIIIKAYFKEHMWKCHFGKKE